MDATKRFIEEITSAVREAMLKAEMEKEMKYAVKVVDETIAKKRYPNAALFNEGWTADAGICGILVKKDGSYVTWDDVDEEHDEWYWEECWDETLDQTYNKGWEVYDLAEKLGFPVKVGVDVLFTIAHDQFFGANIVFMESVLRAMWKKHGDFYMLPSSIEEWLILPAEGEDADELLRIVREVNKSDVVPDEIFLSDDIFLYDGREVIRC